MNLFYINDTKGLHRVNVTTKPQRYDSLGISVMANVSSYSTRVVRVVFRGGYYADLTLDDTLDDAPLVSDDVYCKEYRFAYYGVRKFVFPYLRRGDALRQVLRSCSDDLVVTPEFRKALWHYWLFRRTLHVPDSLSTALRVLALASGFNVRWCGGDGYRITMRRPGVSRVRRLCPMGMVKQPIHMYTVVVPGSYAAVGYQGLRIC